VLVDTLDPAGNVAARDPPKLVGLPEFIAYLQQLIADHRSHPGPDLISAVAADDAPDRFTDQEIVSTSILLLIAGHETTVNLIANGMLTFLRHPTVLKRLREEPTMIIPAVEEAAQHRDVRLGRQLDAGGRPHGQRTARGAPAPCASGDDSCRLRGWQSLAP
jgi:hypothetical protein